jgi:hypothetical protein
VGAEYSWDDLNNTTLQGWTGGLQMTPDMDFFYLNRKPFGINDHYDTGATDRVRISSADITGGSDSDTTTTTTSMTTTNSIYSSLSKLQFT